MLAYTLDNPEFFRLLLGEVWWYGYLYVDVLEGKVLARRQTAAERY